MEVSSLGVDILGVEILRLTHTGEASKSCFCGQYNLRCSTTSCLLHSEVARFVFTTYSPRTLNVQLQLEIPQFDFATMRLTQACPNEFEKNVIQGKLNMFGTVEDP